MRSRLWILLLCLITGINVTQAAKNVTAEVTYNLANGRANYYIWNREDPPVVSHGTTWSIYQCSFPDLQQSCTSSGNSTSVQVYLTEKRSGMRWPVKLKGYMNAEVWDNNSCKGWSTQLSLTDGTGYFCGKGGVQYLAEAKPLTLYLERLAAFGKVRSNCILTSQALIIMLISCLTFSIPTISTCSSRSSPTPRHAYNWICIQQAALTATTTRKI